MGRPNWHYDHPPACTCVLCLEKKDIKPRGFRNIIRTFVDKITGRQK